MQTHDGIAFDWRSAFLVHGGRTVPIRGTFRDDRHTHLGGDRPLLMPGLCARRKTDENGQVVAREPQTSSTGVPWRSAAARTNTTAASNACRQRSSVDHQPVSSGSAPAAIMIAPCPRCRRFEWPTLPSAGFSGSILSASPSSSSRSVRLDQQARSTSAARSMSAEVEDAGGTLHVTAGGACRRCRRPGDPRSVRRALSPGSRRHAHRRLWPWANDRYLEQDQGDALRSAADLRRRSPRPGRFQSDLAAVGTTPSPVGVDGVASQRCALVRRRGMPIQNSRPCPLRTSIEKQIPDVRAKGTRCATTLRHQLGDLNLIHDMTSRASTPHRHHAEIRTIDRPRSGRATSFRRCRPPDTHEHNFASWHEIRAALRPHCSARGSRLRCPVAPSSFGRSSSQRRPQRLVGFGRIERVR